MYTPNQGCAYFSGTLANGSACNADSNGNGLPDIWEFTYFGTIGVDIWADPDSDGDNNIVEFLQGRNPVVSGTVLDVNNVIGLQVYTPLK